MATAASIATKIIDVYKAVNMVKKETDESVKNLINSRPYFKLFENEVDKHPNVSLNKNSDQLIKSYKKLIGALLQLQFGNSTIQNNLEIRLARSIVSDEQQTDRDIEKLLKIKSISSKNITTKKLAERFADVMLMVQWIWSFSERGMLIDSLQKTYGKKMVKMSITDCDNIKKACRSAATKLKKLLKELLDKDINGQTLRNEIETTLAMDNKAYRGCGPLLQKVLKSKKK